MGVATVAVVYAAVRRRFSPAAGLIAGAVLALTPVAALMFRFNNPDALLALLMSVTCYLVVRALEDGRTEWLVWAGVAIGFAFLAKTLQAFLILPALAPRLRRLRAGAAEEAAGTAGPWRPSRSSSPGAGGSRSSSCGRPRHARTSAARRTTASWS
ncbi:glycosyltransferase family 39 protein [Streptomyces thinghirensis]|nr:glycosyltransferase family 39 protein [Streptomyces thinghirensis]